jgi:hypothetical protein
LIHQRICNVARFSIFVHFEREFGVFFLPRAESAVDIGLRSPWLQQSFVLEPFDVGKVAQARQSKRLQEFARRDISEGRAGFRRAQTGVDEIEAFQTADHVAADLSVGEPGNFPLVAGFR